MPSRATRSLLSLTALTAAWLVAGCTVTVREGPVDVDPVHSHSSSRPSAKQSGTGKSTAGGGSSKTSGSGSSSGSSSGKSGGAGGSGSKTAAKPNPNTGATAGGAASGGAAGSATKDGKPNPNTGATAAGGSAPTATIPPMTEDPKGGRLPPPIQNETLFGNGKGGAFRGLIFAIPEGTSSMPDFGKLRPAGLLFLDKFDIKPVDYSQSFAGTGIGSTWFGIRYEGTFSVGAGTWRFRLVSDDGGILYIDGKKVVDNDGAHLSLSKSADVTLTAGRHEIRLDYFHTTGPVSLSLYIANVRDGKERILIGDK